MATFVFNRFDKGEFGKLGAYQAGLQDGYFTSKNMVVYRDGSVGPRWGVIEVVPSTPLPDGKALGFWFNPVTGAELGIIIGDTVYIVGTGTPIATTLDAAPTEPVDTFLTDGGVTHLVSVAEGLYRVNHAAAGASTLTKETLGGDTPGRAVALHGDRLYYASSNRVWYSDAADLTTFGAGSFFDVGYSPHVRFLRSQRNALLIAKQDGSWWIYTGVPGAATLRAVSRVGKNPWHLFGTMISMLGTEEVAFIDNGDDWPTIFNGSTFQRLDHLGFLGAAPGNQKEVGSTALQLPTDVVFVSGLTTPSSAVGRMLQRLYGVWTYHTFGVTVSAQVARTDNPSIFLTDGGGVSDPPRIWEYQTGFDRPAFVSDVTGQPGDNTTTPLDAYLWLPEKWAPNGELMRVRQVTVDFKSWATGVTDPAGYNHFDLTVLALERSGALAPVQTSTVQSFNELPSLSSASGSYRRLTFNVGDQGHGGGFQIRFNNVRGVNIFAVTATADTSVQRAG